MEATPKTSTMKLSAKGHNRHESAIPVDSKTGDNKTVRNSG